MASKKNFDLLTKLENAFISEDIEACKRELFIVLRNMEIEEEESHAFTFSFITHFYTRLAFIIQHVFLHPEFQLTIEQYGRWLGYQSRLNYIFFLSGSRGNSQLIHIIRHRISSINGLQLDSPQKILPYLLLINPTSAQATEDFPLIFARYPRLSYPVLVNFLIFRGYTIPAIYDRQKKLTTLFLQANPDLLPLSLYSNLHHLWSITSYLEKDHNAKIKRKISNILINDLLAKGIEQEPKVSSFSLETEKRKPKLLLMAEHMNKEHVMYDCFGSSLAELREHFEIIGYTAEADRGRSDWTWVDKLVTFDIKRFAFNIEVDKLQKLAPDVVLYPSIGMKMWALMFSRIRLAPLQIALLGHPDLPFSPVIDHVVGGHSLLEKISDQEKIIRLKKTSGSLFGMINRRKLKIQRQTQENKPIRVAVVANVYKMNAIFAAALREIRTRAPKNVEFHVYQNLRGLHFHLSKVQVQEVVGDDRIIFYPSLKTASYYKSLAQNDLLLSPFPFGGENTTLDSLLCKVPVLAICGKEPRERLDYRVLKMSGLSDDLIVYDTESYVSKAVELLNDLDKLETLKSRIDSSHILDVFEKERESARGELAQKVHDLYLKTVE